VLASPHHAALLFLFISWTLFPEEILWDTGPDSQTVATLRQLQEPAWGDAVMKHQQGRPTVASAKGCWEEAGFGKEAQRRKMIKQTSILGVALVPHTSLPNASGSKDWKARKTAAEGPERASSARRKLLFLSGRPGRLHSWTGEQPPGRAGGRDWGRKEESWHRKKAQLNHPHPSSSFCRQLWPRTTSQLPHSRPARTVSLRVAFGFSPVTKVCYDYGLTYPLGH